MAPVRQKTRGMVEADRLKLEDAIVECVANHPKVLSKTCSKDEDSAMWAVIASTCKIPTALCKRIWVEIQKSHDAEEALRKLPHTGSGTKRRANSCRLWEDLSFLREGQPIVQPVSSISGGSPFASNLKKASVPAARIRKRTASETVNEKLLQVAEKISGALDVPHSYETALGISIGQKLNDIEDKALKIKWRGKFAQLLDEMEMDIGGL